MRVIFTDVILIRTREYLNLIVLMKTINIMFIDDNCEKFNMIII